MKSKYKSLSEWRKAEPKVYRFARENKMLNNICETFGWELKISYGHNYWSLDLCKEQALNYNGRWDWQKNHPSSYSNAKKNGWIDECCKHMERKYKPIGYWTKQLCKSEALKHKYASDWERESQSSYHTARRNGWYKECSAHMDRKIKHSGYWTKEKVLEEARKYQYKEDWKKNSYSSHNSARKHGWYKECSAHMTPVKLKWDKDSLLQEAKKYKTISEFKKCASGAYQTANKLGCLNECTKHMVNKKTKSLN